MSLAMAVQEFAVFALVGVLLAGAYVAAVLRWAPSPARTFGSGLVVAAAVYPVFALWAGAAAAWLVLELAGVVGFGALAVPALAGRLGTAGTAGVAAGWALHPLWDLLLHASAVGGLPEAAGAGYVPSWYPPACATFDWAVALTCAVLALRARGERLVEGA